MATIVATTTPFLSISDHRTNAVPASMNCSLPLSSRLRANPSCLFLAAHLRLRPFSASSSPTDVPAEVASSPGSGAGDNGARVRVGAMASTEARQLRESWLASLSCPPPPRGFGGLGGDGDVDGGEFDSGNAGSDWVIGIDPDTHGAVAVLKGHGSDCLAQVFDSPNLPVLVSGRVRRRLDAKSITELLRSLDAPIGSTAYIEQSIPYPKDGKQGWWSGGFGYGLWIGILVAVGFSVVPVPSVLWKRKFELSGSLITKDDSRRVASTLFPSLSSLLKRKKDHGRAEALLIAAYGRGIKMELDSSIAVDELIS